jgi:hypothetical protein
MMETKIIIPILAGLMFGQIFAEGESPIRVSNTVRVGYDDNAYSNTDNKKTTFVKDIVDLSFSAAFTDQTTLQAKSQFMLLDDVNGTSLNPNLYATLSHAVSPRLLMRLTETYLTGDSAGKTGALKEDTRYLYYNNKVGVSADYVLTEKDRIEGSLDYGVLRNEDDEKRGLNGDTTTVEAGTSWKRDIILQRTYSTINLRQRWVEYDHNNSSFEATDLSAGLNHTFTQELQGYAEGGLTQVRPDYPAPSKSESSINPLVRAGLSYSPSPRTRFSGDLGHSYVASGDNNYGGQTTTDLRFGIQREITAKLMAKATASFARTDYSADDSKTTKSNTEDRMDLELRLTYQLNRMNFLEAGIKHTESTSENYSDWERNVVDVGWRIDFN